MVARLVEGAAQVECGRREAEVDATPVGAVGEPAAAVAEAEVGVHPREREGRVQQLRRPAPQAGAEGGMIGGTLIYTIISEKNLTINFLRNKIAASN